MAPVVSSEFLSLLLEQNISVLKPTVLFIAIRIRIIFVSRPGVVTEEEVAGHVFCKTIVKSCRNISKLCLCSDNRKLDRMRWPKKNYNFDDTLFNK